jgi:hypothetical protein
MGDKRIECRLLVGKTEGRRPRRRWIDNIEMNLADTEWRVVD